MGFSPLADMKRRINPCPNSRCRYSTRTGKITGVVIHYNYGVDAYGEATRAGREVSANYWVTNAGALLPNIDEVHRAWTSGAAGYPNGALADQYSVTVEISNSPGFKTSKPMGAISPAAFDMTARLIGDVFRRYNLGPVRRTKSPTGIGVRFHNDFVNTSCPGPWIASKINELLALAEQYRTGKKPTTPTPTPATKPATTTDRINTNMLPTLRPGSTGINVRRLQGLLTANGYSVGKYGIDGSWGNDVSKAFRAFQTKNPSTGTNGKPDNSCGPRSWKKLLGI